MQGIRESMRQVELAWTADTGEANAYGPVGTAALINALDVHGHRDSAKHNQGLAQLIYPIADNADVRTTLGTLRIIICDHTNLGAA
jgi:hypothetical protein